MRHSTSPSRRTDRGFSLIEIMIAVTIIVLMGGIVAVNVFPQPFGAQRDRADLDINNLAQTVRMFELKEGRLPNESEWPTFLFEGSKKQSEGYLEKDKFPDGEVKDPWDQPYIYRKISSSKFDIISYGKDQQPGGEDNDEDIAYIKTKE